MRISDLFRKRFNHNVYGLGGTLRHSIPAQRSRPRTNLTVIHGLHALLHSPRTVLPDDVHRVFNRVTRMVYLSRHKNTPYRWWSGCQTYATERAFRCTCTNQFEMEKHPSSCMRVNLRLRECNRCCSARNKRRTFD